ncbi:MAG: carbohydrate ABC transporter substrate-binding protein [Spirochaetes bacterium]|nr:MAG: carbohydrate ABC transporter substrate-binding protein [Spirochaetota bacterium]
MKKFVLVLTVMFLVFSQGLFASGGDEAAVESDKPVVLTFLIDKNTQIDAIRAVAEAFEKKTGIITEFEFHPGSAEGENVIKTRLATGEMADLIYFNSGSLLTALNPERNFADLTNEPYMDTFASSYKQTVTVDGKIYGVPSGSAAAGGILYNKKVYDDLGLEVPVTWDEYMDNCQVIKDAGKTAIIGSYKDDWTSQLILLADYYYVQEQVPDFADRFTRNEAKYATTPAALEAFNKYKEVFERGFMNSDFLATTYDDAQAMLISGDGVHYHMATWIYEGLAVNYPDQVENIRFFAQPDNASGLNGITVWLPNSVYVYKDGENVNAAKQWVEFFISNEGIDVSKAVNPPKGPYVVRGVELPEGTLAGVLDAMVYFNEDRSAPALEFITPVKAPNSPAICVEVGSGITEPLEAAAKYDRDTEKQAKQLNLPGW